MEHYSVLLLVQDHSPKIPGLFLVSILESELNPEKQIEGPFEVASMQSFLVAWDGVKIDLLKRYSYGVPSTMPENHAFDIIEIIKEYILKYQ